MSFVNVLTTNSEGHNRPAEQANDRGRDAPNGHAMENAAATGPNRAEPGRALIATSLASSDGGRPTASAWAVEVARLEPFAVDVQRRDDVAIVQPRGELDLATVETLHAALDDIKGAGRLVLDLRGLSFIDCAGLHLLVALHQRAQSDGFQLALLAPAAPADKAIKLVGLDRALPFVAPGDALDSQPGESASRPASWGMGQT
jgi:anti-anti-sigma factor